MDVGGGAWCWVGVGAVDMDEKVFFDGFIVLAFVVSLDK